MVNERSVTDSNNSSETADPQEVEGATCGADGSHGATADETLQTYRLCLIHGGMDTGGQIFDDTLVYLLK